VTFPDTSILIVDDEPAVRHFLSEGLARAGFRCMEAATAADALDAVMDGAPDIVLTDVGLPDGSGIALVDALMPLTPPVAAVVLTGSEDPEIPFVAVDAGAFGFIRKPFDIDDLLIVLAGALRRRDLAIEDHARHEQLLDDYRFETVDRLARVIESRDSATAAHVGRMSSLAYEIARALGWTEAAARSLRVASALHDVGKVGIPDRILRKNGPLTPAERQQMETHPDIGRAILSGATSDLLRLAETVAWTHHERVDGGGYPRGLVGTAIPPAGRIAAVADVFDALTSDQPYRAAIGGDEALALMRDDAGLDQEIVRALISVLERRGWAGTNAPMPRSARLIASGQ
jgi:putative two-component system response regulator